MKARSRPVEAEGGGFEPPVPKFEYVSLANWWFQPLTHPSKPISLKEWCKCREKKLLYKIIGAKNCGSACRRPKSLFCGIVTVCCRAVGSVDRALRCANVFCGAFACRLSRKWHYGIFCMGCVSAKPNMKNFVFRFASASGFSYICISPPVCN